MHTIRASTLDQNPAVQIASFDAAGCTMNLIENGNGAALQCRSELGVILDLSHPGEALVVPCIDRPERTRKDLQVIVRNLRESGANIAATGQLVETATRGRHGLH